MPATLEQTLAKRNRRNGNHAGLFRWSRDQYYKMLEKGILDEGEKAELIDGLITQEGMTDRMTQNSHHMTACGKVRRALRHLEDGDNYHLRIAGPLSVGPASEPEPDIALVSGDFDDYANTHPTTALLVIEVSDASLKYDRTQKASLYASAGIPEYWIVNLREHCVDVHREPVEDGGQPFGWRYSGIHRATSGEVLDILSVPEQSITVDSLLP